MAKAYATCRICKQLKPPGFCVPCRRANGTRANHKARGPRKCARCAIPLPRYRSVCDECQADKFAEGFRRWAKAHPGDSAARYKRWAERHPEEAAQQKHQIAARRKGVPGSHTLAEWEAILHKHGGRCADCGVGGKLTKDHINPVSRGGTDYAYNLQPLCKRCNSRKHATIRPGVHPSLFDRAA